MKRKSEEEKKVNIDFRTKEHMTRGHRLEVNQWLDYSRETYEGYGYDYEIIGKNDIQINTERTRPSLGSLNEVPPGLRDKTKARIIIRSNKYNRLRLCVTAALYTVTDHATKENKYIKNLVEDWEEDNEYVYDSLTKIQNNYNINI